MAPIILYHAPISPFSRSVILLARYYKIDLEVKIIDLIGAKDHLKPEFIKINPQHSVPTIDDNGFYLWESRAILIYLVEKCKPDLYPSSAQERAVLNQRLQFELGGLTAKYDNIFLPVLGGATTEVSDEKIKALYDAFSVINEHFFPNNNEWLAGKNVTAADFAFVGTISTLVEMGASLENYPKLQAWFERCKTTFPGYEELNGKGAKMFGQFFLSRVTKGF